MNLMRIRRKTRRAIKRTIFSALKRSPKLRQRFRLALYARRGRRYARMCAHTTVDPKLVIFECFAGRSYSDSPRAIYQAMLADERYADHTFVWAFKPRVTRALAALPGFDVRRSVTSPDGGRLFNKLDFQFGAPAIEELRRSVIVTYASPEYYRLHAQAGLWIANYVLPTHMPVRDGQTYVQTWHGTPLKRLGCDIAADKQNAMYSVDDIHSRYSREGRRFTYLLSPSRFTSEKLATAFDLGDRAEQVVIEEGYPRNDFLLTHTAEQVAALKERFGIPADKRVILYAPTFRDDQHDPGVGYVLDPAVDFEALRNRLGDDHVVLFRPHYLVANSFDFSAYEGFVFNVSAVRDVNDLYVVSDVLVTDYSSVFFDYANLKRPVIFFMYDLDRYAEQLRGFYLDLTELPGPIVTTADALVDEIVNSRGRDTHTDEAYKRFTERFSYLDDGHAAERVIERIRTVDSNE